jgi:hypothetical protein
LVLRDGSGPLHVFTVFIEDLLVKRVEAAMIPLFRLAATDKRHGMTGDDFAEKALRGVDELLLPTETFQEVQGHVLLQVVPIRGGEAVPADQALDPLADEFQGAVIEQFLHENLLRRPRRRSRG